MGQPVLAYSDIGSGTVFPLVKLTIIWIETKQDEDFLLCVLNKG